MKCLQFKSNATFAMRSDVFGKSSLFSYSTIGKTATLLAASFVFFRVSNRDVIKVFVFCFLLKMYCCRLFGVYSLFAMTVYIEGVGVEHKSVSM